MIFYTSNHSPFQRGLSPTEPNLINSTNPYSNTDKTDESHHQSPPKTEDTSKENMRHHQNRLMKSGDIETNPGPRNPKKKTMFMKCVNNTNRQKMGQLSQGDGDR